MAANTSPSPTWPPPPFKSQKCWECESPIIVFHVQRVGGNFAEDGTRVKDRSYLVADARQATFGISAGPERPEDLKPAGAVVAQLRKHAPAPAVGPLLRETATGDWWLPLYVTRANAPQFWFHLASGTPPELSFVDAEGTVLVRKSSQGTFTKRRALGRPLPTPAGLAEGSLVDGTTKVTAESDAPSQAGDAESPGETAPPKGGTALALLPDFQREARDRIARRAKTMAKAVTSIKRQGEPSAEAARLTTEARLLAANLHRVAEGSWKLEVDHENGERVTLTLDPEESPGKNLQLLWDRIKKLKRADTAVTKQAAATSDALAALTTDLERLRSGPLPQAEVEAILARHKIAMAARPPGGGTTTRRSITSAKSGGGTPLPYRIFRPQADAATKGPRVMVGKSAADSDTLATPPTPHDWWLHAVGTTGSHVLIPAVDCKGVLDQALLRAAGVLAIHYSKRRDERRGEVYVSRRQQIKKRKGMAPGLWQVERAETIFVAYEADELKRCLDALEPSL